MVRFRYKRPKELKADAYFPYYIETWTNYDPNDTTNCTQGSWSNVWTIEDSRDGLHHKNSYYYRPPQDEDQEFQDTPSPTLAILLFGSIIFCLFVPQILDLILSTFCQRPERPPSPPPPPPGPKNRMKIRLYHYAKVSNPTAGRKSIVGRDNFYYDPDNILNYVSQTRIKALHEYSDEEEFEDDLASIRMNHSHV